MKTGARIVALALAGVLGYGNVPLHAAEHWSPLKMKPMMAASLDEGDKHIVGYFVEDGGVCKLTLMITDSSNNSDVEPTNKPSRLLVTVSSGKSAKFDTIEGKTISFSCEENARSMSATELDHLALHMQPE